MHRSRPFDKHLLGRVAALFVTVTMGTASVAVAQTPLTFAPHAAKDKAVIGSGVSVPSAFRAPVIDPERTRVPVVVTRTQATLFQQAMAATTRHVATSRLQQSWASRHPGRVVGIILAAALGVMLITLAYRLSKE